MLRDLRMSLLILLLSSAVGAAVNSFRATPIPWIRGEPPTAAATTSSANSQTASAPSEKPGVVTMEIALQHLAAGTAHFIDAREAKEYAEGRLRGAINLPSSAIFQNSEAVLSVIPPDAKVIVYCGGGDCEASHTVSDTLRQDFGYTDVSIYENGWAEIESSARFTEFIEKGTGA